ncbi:MAG: Ig-like domain repeat protein [Betaproteobacteria bacterium]|nr:Ig-like domain repeat protein [Betaproteobacteria bacterium]
MLLSAFLLAGNVAADTPAAPSFAGGNGTQANPFQISTLAELRLFMETPVLGFFPNNAYYLLTATIDAADTSTWLAGAGWQPVDATLMDGFDGQNFEIQNLYVNRPAEDGVGLFKLAGGICCKEVKNIRIAGGQITGRDQVGGLSGSADAAATISNNHSTATIAGRSDVGGLVGNSGNSPISGSSSGGTVTGTGDFVGGLVGRTGGGKIESSHATGHITGKKQVGGLIGVYVQGSAPALTSSWATGQVDGDDRVGGLIGDSQGKVTFSYATGAVAATGLTSSVPTYAFAGGLLGIQDNHGTEDSYASGAVSGPLSGVGGLMGSNAGPILRSATIAGQTVMGGASASSVGGLVGDNKGPITASRSASTVNASGTVDSIGGLVGANTTAGAAITTSYATGSVTAANAVRVGGLVGWHTGGAINGSHAHGNVSGADDVGGLIGLSTTAAVNTSHATGAVSGASFVGGLIGNRGSGSTDTTFAMGTVTASGDDVGGLLGFNGGPVKKSYARQGTVSGEDRVGGLVGRNQGTIETSYAIKSVSGTTYVGGLVGQSASTNFGIRDCYARGAVTGSDKVGGLVGRNELASNVARCYASGTLTPTGAGSVGGLIGDNQGGANTDNYWNADSTGLPGIGTGTTTGATGLTNVQMKQQASFIGFVFPSPWLIDEGITEPYLDWAAVAVTGTSTSLASSANPSALGLSVTFTATVTGNAPTGTVLFQDGAVPLSGCIAVALTGNQAQCTAGGLALGSHGISAVYSGDGLNTGSLSPTLSQVVILPTLDVDASISDSKYDALTDGLLTLRYLFGRTGTALVTGALGATATRTDPAEIEGYLDAIRPLLDIDDNGSVDPSTDGMLILRYLFGLRGNALIAGAFDPMGNRNTAGDIETYIESLLP